MSFFLQSNIEFHGALRWIKSVGITAETMGHGVQGLM
jgi:hypothetical protein